MCKLNKSKTKILAFNLQDQISCGISITNCPEMVLDVLFGKNKKCDECWCKLITKNEC